MNSSVKNQILYRIVQFQPKKKGVMLLAMHKLGYVYNKAGLLKSVITNLIKTNTICIIVSKGKNHCVL